MATKTPPKNTPIEFEIGTGTRYREPDFQARLVGEVYDVYLPKSAASIALARSVKTDKRGKAKIKGGEDASKTIEAMYEWAESAFGSKQWPSIHARLLDSRDALDIDHISEFMKKVVEHQTEGSENPTS